MVCATETAILTLTEGKYPPLADFQPTMILVMLSRLYAHMHARLDGGEVRGEQKVFVWRRFFVLVLSSRQNRTKYIPHVHTKQSETLCDDYL